MKPAILFIAPHRPDRAPSQRFRFEQYLEYLSEQGIECAFSYLVSEKEDKILYSKKSFFKKIILFFKFLSRRFGDVLRANKFQIIYIQREAFFSGPAFFEYLFSHKKAKLIYDFDDSIWLPNVSDANRKFNWAKNYSKTSRIIKYADLVFAGNHYLSDYALQFNKNVVIIPTTVNTSEYKPFTNMSDSAVCIGWSGSATTLQHFNEAIPFLTAIKEKFAGRVCFRVIGDGNYSNPELGIQGIAWNKDNEIKELQKIHIGIMPLPDDEWAKGKCGLKGLQYMALGIPAIMSPVGVNTEIIQDGVNGFLASTEQEWIEKISQLIEDPELRMKMGAAGRKTVEEKYSFHVWKDKYLELFNNLLKT